MQSDIKGCSTCPTGTEQHESFRRGKKTFVQYDFRNEKGTLFSCVAPSLMAARMKRDIWSQQQG